MEYQLATANIKAALDTLAKQYERIGRALEQVGYPEERRREHSFETLARLVVGQQVSVAAATSINQKPGTALGGQRTATEVLTASDELLRRAG